MTEQQLKKIASYASAENIKIYTPLLNKWMPFYNINTSCRQAAFLAQIIHESGSFNYTKEIASGAAYDTGRLAIKLGNTPQRDGDGEKYKGRGLIQITGRDNYKSASKGLKIDFIKNPELLEHPDYAVQSACWWWTTHGLNELSDKGDFQGITKIINGGYNGYLDRIMYYKRALNILK